MIVLAILLLLLFRREMGILLLSISEFISNALKTQPDDDQNQNYSTTNKKDK
jgi:hypothetical protein